MIKIMTMKEMMKLGAEEMDELDKSVKVDGDWITLDQWYDVSLDSINTERSLLMLLAHLTEKTWFTTAMANVLIVKVCKQKGWWREQEVEE